MNNEDKILKKLNDHDEQFEKIDKNFDLIGKKLKEHDKHFAEVDKKLDKHQVILENLVAKALGHDDKFVKIEEKIQASQDRILEAIDSYAKKTTDVEIEQTATSAMLIRHEDEIIKIKKVVKLA
ncbi:MAG: hypothetical protein NTY30_02410 [Candidatus Berkelbacteria bacterium]|nr:hypothetical protein [Candidatus Berkelbacteria bacterium]